MKKYRVRNIDCAVCAAKIETGVRELPGVDAAVLDFATQTLHLRAESELPVLEKIRQIDPGVEVLPLGESDSAYSHDDDFSPKRDIVILGIAGLLFAVLLIFEERMHQSAFPFVEYPLVIAAYLLAGWNVIFKAAGTVIRKNYFDENVLMVIATTGALAIHAMNEAVGVMIFFKIGEFLQNMAVSRSRRSIRSLLAARPNIANLKELAGIRQVPPESVAVGAVILVKPGEKVPLDGEVLSGSSQLDTSALTGEPVPVGVRPGSGVMAGHVNLTDALEIRVGKPFGESSISKVLDLVENAVARKAKTEQFATTFAKYYTPAVVFTALCIAFIPPLMITGATFGDWIYRALVLLVISCPCALVVSIPLGYFGGIGKASRSGVLVKGSEFIDALSKVKTVIFDKTGTLTQGVFEVRAIEPANGHSPEQLLELAAFAEQYSNHPIARSVLAAYEKSGKTPDSAIVESHSEIPGGGVKAVIGGKTVLVGNDRLMHLENIRHDRCVFNDTVVGIAVDGVYAGHIAIGDKIREEAAESVSKLRQYGVEEIVMLTGDNEFAAKSVSKKLKLDAYYAGLLPEEKVSVFEKINDGKRHDGKIAFVGDGINDAPVIARSDIGIAMGGLGSDAAMETADVVLMTDSPLKLSEAIRIGRQTRSIVMQNIVLSLAIKGVFVVLGAFGVASMWEAVFADMGTALLAIGNSARILASHESQTE